MNQTIYKSTPVDPYSNRGLVSRRKHAGHRVYILIFQTHSWNQSGSEDISLQNQLVHPVSTEAMETTVRDVNVLLSFSTAFSFFSFCGVWYNGAKSIMRNKLWEINYETAFESFHPHDFTRSWFVRLRFSFLEIQIFHGRTQYSRKCLELYKSMYIFI